MEITLANYSLPAMCQVVCTLVAAGISSVNVRNTVPDVTQPPPQYQPPSEPPTPYDPVARKYRLPTLPTPRYKPTTTTQAPKKQRSTTQEPEELPELPLPDGYVEYPEIGFAYKVYDDQVTWVEARDRCVDDDAQLALIDTLDKLTKVKTQKQSSNFAHVGIIRMFDGKVYVAVSTGASLTSSAVPWSAGEPNSLSDCVDIDFEKNGLGTYACISRANYVCEIPILQESTLKPHESAYAVDEPPEY